MARDTKSGNPSRRTQLSLVGTRAYVLGADLFREFEGFAVEELPSERLPSSVRSFKLHREIASDGTWHFDEATGTASADLEFVDALGRAGRATFLEDGETIRARVPDPAPRLARLEPDLAFAGTASLSSPRSTSELLYALVEGNKAFHVKTLAARGLPHDRIRFIYVERLPWIREAARGEVALSYRHLGARPAQGRTYTLTEVRTSLSLEPVRICYSYGH